MNPNDLGPAGAVAFARQRANHTGTQPIDTVEGLGEALLGGIRLSRSIQRLGDHGQTLHADFAYNAYGLGSPLSCGVDNALEGEELFTVERATPKWVFGPNGKLREVPPNTLARQWNPETGEPEGVLIEESRTNRLTWSEDVAGWSTGSATELEATSVPSPIPGVNYLKFYTLDDASQANISKNYNISDRVNGVHTCSFFVKSAGAAVVRFQIGSRYDPYSRGVGVLYLETGEFSYHVSGAFTNINGSAIPLGNGEYRVSVTGVQNADANLGLYVYAYDEYGDGIDNSIAAGSGLYVTGFQVEEASTPSSYIPTEDAPVTRAADNVSRELGEEFNQEQFTLFIHTPSYPPETPDSRRPISIGAGSGNNRIVLRDAGWAGFYRGATDETQRLPDLPDSLGGEAAKIAISYSRQRLRIYINGWELVDLEHGDPLEGVNNFRLGRGQVLSNERVNVAFETAVLYPRALSKAELIELTS